MRCRSSLVLVAMVLSPWLVQVTVADTVRTAPEMPAFEVRDREPSVSLEVLATLATLPAPTRVWVYLTDKAIFDSETCARHLDAYATTLSERVLRRRAKMGGARPVDFHDLPLHRPHVDRLIALGADVHRESRWLNAVSVRATDDVLRAIVAEPFVARLALVRGSSPRPQGYGRPASGPQSSGAAVPRAGDPFDYGPSRDQLDEIGVIAAHAAGYSGAGVVVAMFDTGYMKTHEGMDHLAGAGRILSEYDFVDDDGETDFEPGDDPAQYFHGTATWSLVSALAEGELIGVAHGADVLLAKTEDITSETPVEEDNWIAAAEWADLEGADVINTSLTYWDWYTYEDMDGDTAPITVAADLAVAPRDRGLRRCGQQRNPGLVLHLRPR